MCRKLLLSLFFFFYILTGYSQVQNGVVKYKIKENDRNIEEVLNDSELSTDMVQIGKMMFQKVYRALPYISYQLKLNNNESLFELKNTYMSNDSGVDIDLALSYSNSHGIFYINLEEDLYSHYRNYLEKDWLIQDVLEEKEWELTREVRVIQGYTCFKAIIKEKMPGILKDEVVAWFSPNLPYQFGPIGYYGLPGLILELERGFYTFYADEINFNEEKIKINRPNKGEIVSREEYKKKTKEISNRLKDNYR